MTRRSHRALSASGDGFNPSFSSRARMKRSISLRGHFRFLTSGTGTELDGGMNAQCGWYFAPWAIQSRRVFFSFRLGAGREDEKTAAAHHFVRVGGKDLSHEQAFFRFARDDGVFGRIFARREGARRSWSRRRSGLAAGLESGPWHLKQRSEMMGRMSRLYWS